jgi:hypothetical protein
MPPIDSRPSDSTNSPPQKSESPVKHKRVYCQLGILESRADFAKRMYQAMLDEGILPPPKQAE